MADIGVQHFATFGDLLKHLRLRAGLTQDELGLAVGYSRAHIARLENSQRIPDVAMVQASFVDALHLKNEPATVAQLITLARMSRDKLSSTLPTVSMPVKSTRHTANNLPFQVTSFIGREHVLVDLRHLLSPGSTRLLTLTGSGGVGKTRLALQLAVGLLDAYPGGLWFVELAPLDDPALVPQAVATVLGVHEEPGRPMLETLVDHLRDQQLLLLLDNCEHLIEAVAHLIEALLRECRSVYILATSREALRIPAEITRRVPSLTLAEAAQLFEDRARAAASQFIVTERNTSALAQVCTQLDGIPLAIELAAARIGVLSVEDIATRLGDRFHLLTGGSRTAPPRQQTLRKAIDWSYDLLSELECILFRRLGVFIGGWTLQEAEAICSDAAVEAADVLDLLAGLVSKSLVVAVTNANDVAGLTRYHLLETLRQYALEKLSQAAEDQCVRERHINYFIALGEAVALEWDSPTPQDPANQAKRLDLDFDNVRHALEWAAETGRIDAAIHLLEAFWPTLFIVRAVDLELLRWLERLVAHPAAPRNERLGRAYLMVSELYFGQDKIEQARTANEQARRIGLALENSGLLNKADFQLALLALECGDYALARSIFDRLQTADETMRGDWPKFYGFLALYEGDFLRARDYFVQTYAFLHAGTSNKIHASGSGRLLGYALAPLGDYAEAARMLHESMVENLEMGDLRAVAACLGAYGVLAVAQTEWSRAARLFGASESLIESIHDFIQYFDRTQIRRNVAVLHAQLDEATLNAEWAVGRAMTLEQAMAYALTA